MSRVISVTRRHVEFLAMQAATVERIIARQADIDRLAEGDWQLASADDDHAGEDIEP